MYPCTQLQETREVQGRPERLRYGKHPPMHSHDLLPGSASGGGVYGLMQLLSSALKSMKSFLAGQKKTRLTGHNWVGAILGESK